MFGGSRSKSAGRKTRKGGMSKIVVPGVLTGAVLLHGPSRRRGRKVRKSRRVKRKSSKK